MNKIINGVAGYLKDHKINFKTDDKNEEVIWFVAKLPNGSADLMFFISYNEDESSFIMLINRIARFREVRTELTRLMNSYNADPETYNSKMYIDSQGDIVVSCCATIKSGSVLEQIVDYIDICVESIQKYYPEIVKVIEDSAQPAQN